jgi:hypothetical protein
VDFSRHLRTLFLRYFLISISSNSFFSGLNSLYYVRFVRIQSGTIVIASNAQRQNHFFLFDIYFPHCVILLFQFDKSER